MRKVGLRGAIRGRKPLTSTPTAKAAGSFQDVVQGRFTADAPNRLRIADITFTATWSGFAYVTFVTEGFAPQDHRVERIAWLDQRVVAPVSPRDGLVGSPA